MNVSEDPSTVEIEVRETAALWAGLKCPDDGVQRPIVVWGAWRQTPYGRRVVASEEILPQH